MIRVTKTDEPSKTTVTVDGELSIESVCVVETCCHQAASAGKPVQLFLRDVTTLDQAGRKLLGRLSAGGVRLAAAGLYNSYIVERMTSGDEATRTLATRDDDRLAPIRKIPQGPLRKPA